MNTMVSKILESSESAVDLLHVMSLLIDHISQERLREFADNCKISYNLACYIADKGRIIDSNVHNDLAGSIWRMGAGPEDMISAIFHILTKTNTSLPFKAALIRQNNDFTQLLLDVGREASKIKA